MSLGEADYARRLEAFKAGQRDAKVFDAAVDHVLRLLAQSRNSESAWNKLQCWIGYRKGESQTDIAERLEITKQSVFDAITMCEAKTHDACAKLTAKENSLPTCDDE